MVFPNICQFLCQEYALTCSGYVMSSSTGSPLHGKAVISTEIRNCHCLVGHR